MARTSLHKSLKQGLHGNEGLFGLSGDQPTASEIVVASHDTCINRENPNRDISQQENLVVGYDFDGTYDNLIKKGFTQGYWTMPPFIHPSQQTDSAGQRNRYLSRILLEFDLQGTDAFQSGRINHAFLSLTFSSHKNLARVDGITLGLHTFYCGSSFTGGGGTGGNTLGNRELWDGTATWNEWKYTGAPEYISGVGGGVSGPDDPDTVDPHGGAFRQSLNAFTDNVGISHPANVLPTAAGFSGNIWTMQGLGATGGIGQSYVNTSGAIQSALKSGQFMDFAQGASFGGHYAALATNGVLEANTDLYPQVYLTNKIIKSNSRLEIDLTKAVRSALLLAQGMVRIMINVEGDFRYNLGEEGSRAKDRAWVGFHSKETRNEPGRDPVVDASNKVVSGRRPKFAPHLIINFDKSN